MKRLLALIAITLFGCSQTPAPTAKHYSLAAQPLPLTEPVSLSTGTLILSSLTIDHHLQHKGPVLLMADGRLHISQQHRWAGALPNQLQRLTQESLAMLLPHWQQVGRKHTPAPVVLEIEISRLFGAPDGTTRLSGRYRLYKQQQLILQRSFALEQQQAASGYAAMTDSMRSLWLSLMTQVSQSIIKP
ncbi:PqiC family protein [Ferrimonas pelagia]|uniref:PqiC family protein n=1 Tax=Ferrimonas pelagia TaxID=1177826 RepID=A0ABP9EWU7_9GAMM